MSSDIRVLPPPDSGPSSPGGLCSMLSEDFQGTINSVVDTNPKFGLVEVLPCANVNVEKYAVCENPGKQACSACKFVSYCSKECQRAHWGTHKSDCKNSIRSSNWQPAWMVERRDPSFLDKSDTSTGEKFANRHQDRLSLGSSLWGNVPAMDIVNLPNNEKDLKTDLTLAFAASGDIRNVVATVNALGPYYSGKLDIHFNDLNPYIVSRNIALLLILGTIPDEAIAADIALHFWYSVFLRMEYRLRILSMVSTLLKEDDSVRKLLMENVGPVMSLEQAQMEYKRVRKAPSRVDFRDRMYMGLQPSHRLAFLEYRQFGIVLPFGALDAHYNVPNPSLFADGMWLQTDFADPLESWDMDKVFAAGKAHGAQPEDVYGCLYFYLSDQLRAFARHLRQHRISFHIFSSDACALAQVIAQGTFSELGLPSTLRFDRIDVSNIMDPNYVGIRDVIDAWGPLLAKTDNAALTGYFMNWVAFVDSGRVADAGQAVLMGTLDLMKKGNRLRPAADPMLSVYLAMHDIDAFYDTSKPFSKFWKNCGGADVKLQLRTAHKIIPHRVKTAIDAKPGALPEFANDETWYRYTRLINRTWVERYVELIPSEV